MNFFSKPGRSARRPSQSTRRARRFAPNQLAPDLESRLLMAAGPLGINLAGTLGFVDLMKETRAFTPLNGSTLPTDANGWPQADAQIIVLDDRVNQPWNGPDANAVQPDIGGTYHLSFTGNATVSPDWLNNYTVQNQVYNAATNTTTADLVVTHNSLAMLYIDFRNTVNPASSTGAGVSNVKLIQPGYAANTTQMFTNTMINDLSPFGTVRYLNVDQANNYAPTYDAGGNLVPLQWSQRKLPSAASQTAGAGQPGEAWEYMVALANATNTDMWINIPGPASNDYVAQLANLIKNGDTVNGVTYAGLNANLKVNIEFSNEVWGGTYNPYAYNMESAKQQVAAGNSPLNNDGATDQGVWAQRNYLQRTMQITNIFRGVFGADPSYSKIRPVLGWGEGQYQYYTATFPWFEKTYGAPSQFFYGMGNANYNNPTDYSSVDNLIASLYTSLNTEAAWTQDYATIANYYGLKVVAYEGGPSTGDGTTAAQEQVALAASRDPRMENFIAAEYDTWYANGGNLAMVYDGPYDQFTPNNQFSLVENAQAATPTASAKYRGVVDLSTAGAQAITSGFAVAAAGVTTIPTAADSFGASFPSFSASQPNYWLINVASAGNYVLNLQTGANSAVGKVTVALSDSAPLGTFTLNPAGNYNLATLPLHAGLNTLVISTLAAFTPTSLTLTPATAPVAGAALTDPSFEADQLGSGNFLYDPTGTPWAYSGQAGLTANNSGFTAGNPAAPMGSQVAFVQGLGTLTQTVTNFVAGNYHLSFSAAMRGNWGTAQTFQVLVDNAVVGTFTPSSTSYISLSTASIPVAAGTHTITFKGTTATGDATDFLDGVALTQDTTATASAAAFGDASFEAAQLPAGYGGYLYAPAGTPWNFTGQAGVTGNATAFTVANPAAPQGSQVAFVQNLGTISQSVSNFVAGNYHLTFSAAMRGNWGTAETFQVLVDGTTVGTFTPSSTTYTTLNTATFAVTAGAHVVTFKGTTAAGDATDFLDGIALTQDPSTTAAAASFGDASFEAAQLPAGYGGYVYDPTGTPWSYTGQAGVTGNGTGFTVGNPNAPVGSQVAFVQDLGTISQTVSNFAAGNYYISFSAAQRGNYGGVQTFQVLVDGVLVGTFTPSSTSYTAMNTATFPLTAGSHTIMFKGTVAQGDSTAFLDGVAVTPNNTVTKSSFGDSGFEAANVGSTSGNYMYQPTGTPWGYTGLAGVTGNGTGFTAGNPNAPQGNQVGFVQNTGAISQTIANMSAGNYSIAFAIAQRGNYGWPQTIQVLVDGVVVGTFSPAGTSYTTVNTSAFKLTSGSHTFTFQGTNTVGDGTAFMDAVTLTAQ